MKCVLTLVVFVICWSMSEPYQGRIPVGSIFEHGEPEAKTGFLFAIANFNKRKDEQFKLTSFVEVIHVKDSFELATSICKHMETGIFMLFGQRRIESSNTIEAYTTKFHVPYVSPSFADNVPHELPTFQLHMRPSHTRALVDLIKHYGWKTFHYVYDSEEGLYRLQEILRIFADSRYSVQVRMRRLVDVRSAHEDLRALDKMEEPDNGTEKYIVLDLSRESHYHAVLQQVREVGMNKHGYNYILGTLDFLILETERYQHGGVNITGFQLVNYSSTYVKKFLKPWRTLDPNIWHSAGNNSVPIEAALAYDAVQVIHKTLAQLISNSTKIFKHTFRRGHVYNYNRTKGVPCESDDPLMPLVPWMHGEAIMDGMKKLHFDGVTGNIEFNEYGFRRNYKFDVYNVGLNNGPNKIGIWDNRGGVYKDGDECLPEVNMTDGVSVYRVTSIADEPFLMIKKENKDGVPYVGNERYEGYCVDLAKMVAKRVGFEYKIQLVKDKKYGALEKTVDNVTRWNGMIGELVRKESDIAIAPLSITSIRESVVHFSKPYMDVGISIMIKKPDKEKPGVFSFMQPFTWQFWMCIIFGYFSVGVGIFLVSRFSSAEWRRMTMNRKMTYNNFTLANSLWFAMGSLMLQGSDESCPRSASGRIIGGAWWFACLITISSYTANLAAFLTIETLSTPIESADDLVKQSDIAYGTLNSGSTQTFFRDSKVSTYKQMWIYMESNPTVFVENIDEGIKRVRNSKGKYAFLMESVYNEYANNRKPCNTMKVGHNLNSNHYGIATRRNLPLRDDITLAVLSLTEDGTLERMKKDWWEIKGECGFDTGHRESKKKSLSLSNVAGIYFILIAGLVLAIIVGVCEFMYIKSKPERVPSAMIYMMPSMDTADCMEDDVPEEVKQMYMGNHKATNGPASPVNGNAGHNNHFRYDSTYSPPRITFNTDSNTAV
ncbi:glutamate receptor 2-like [Mercenaria mercenaria]|uniref:glutamate receptor 2-like n=1 Tax=Mercenaria mercenaria TaxID=6596 RepID=UPI00234E891F|nr:glutamate receptor 2-like [Mercenaria mercenaria]